MLFWAVVAGLVFGLGLTLLAQMVLSRQDRLVRRVLAPDSQALPQITGLRWSNAIFGKLGSTSASVTERLDSISSSTGLDKFRLKQVFAGIAGMSTAATLAVIVSTARPVSVWQWVVMVMVGFVVGALAYDWMLTNRVNTVSRRVSSQVADAAELLSLSLSAGESVPAALLRIQGVVGAELAGLLASALTDIENGVSVTKALTRLSSRTRSAQLTRLLDTLVASMERGAPLATTLREQARDLRDEARRNLMESGGRREIAMLFPVVFIILPVTVVFALYPGLVALRF